MLTCNAASPTPRGQSTQPLGSRHMLGAMPPSASLVIPTRDRSRALARTLAALTRQRRTDFEVVIVDDGSTDDTAAMLDGFRDRLDLTVVRQAGRGIAAARTVAMRAARAPILIQTDDDRVPDADFVADHVAAHAAGPRVVAGQQRGLLAAWSVADDLPAAALAAVVARDPAVAAAVGAPAVELVSPEALAADLDGALARLAVDEPWWVRHGGPLRARYGADLDGFAFPWAAAIGGNTSVPAELAAAVGYLDDGFVSWGLEDTDFHYRLCQAGARVHLLDGGRSYHQLHRRGPDLARSWVGNARRLVHKHADPVLSTYLVAIVRGEPLPVASDTARALAAASPAVAAEVVRCHRELINLAAR